MSDLVITSNPDATVPHVTIRLAQSDDAYMLTLRELTVEEMLQGDDDVLTHDGPDQELDVEEVRIVDYGQRTATG